MSVAQEVLIVVGGAASVDDSDVLPGRCGEEVKQRLGSELLLEICKQVVYAMKWLPHLEPFRRYEWVSRVVPPASLREELPDAVRREQLQMLLNGTLVDLLAVVEAGLSLSLLATRRMILDIFGNGIKYDPGKRLSVMILGAMPEALVRP